MSKMSEEVLTRTILKIKNIYQFESTIPSSFIRVIESVKNWNKNNPFPFEIYFDLFSSISIHNTKVYDSVTIRGYVKTEFHNRHTISNGLYLFFEYLMRECNQNQLQWIFDGELYMISKL